mmetsp:Transcript_132650/g.229513  ORF Transcript_132650/g.229513 Transcript_132650/m.229513 type:complete len:386 (+) Transcript_132650:93-1250(+)
MQFRFLMLACFGCVGHGRRTRTSSISPGQAAFNAPFRLEEPVVPRAAQRGARASVPVSAEQSVPPSAGQGKEAPMWMEWENMDSAEKVSKKLTAKMKQDMMNEVILEKGKDEEDTYDYTDLHKCLRDKKGIFAEPAPLEVLKKHLPDWAIEKMEDKEERQEYEDFYYNMELALSQEMDVPGRTWDWMYDDSKEEPAYYTACYSPKELAYEERLPVEFILSKLMEAGVPKERLKVKMPVRTFATEEQQQFLVEAINGLDGTEESLSVIQETLVDLAEEMPETSLDEIMGLCKSLKIPLPLDEKTRICQSDFDNLMDRIHEKVEMRGGWKDTVDGWKKKVMEAALPDDMVRDPYTDSNVFTKKQMTGLENGDVPPEAFNMAGEDFDD